MSAVKRQSLEATKPQIFFSPILNFKVFGNIQKPSPCNRKHQTETSVGLEWNNQTIKEENIKQEKKLNKTTSKKYSSATAWCRLDYIWCN